MKIIAKCFHTILTNCVIFWFLIQFYVEFTQTNLKFQHLTNKCQGKDQQNKSFERSIIFIQVLVRSLNPNQFESNLIQFLKQLDQNK